MTLPVRAFADDLTSKEAARRIEDLKREIALANSFSEDNPSLKRCAKSSGSAESDPERTLLSKKNFVG
jgi:hypothetical protein